MGRRKKSIVASTLFLTCLVFWAGSAVTQTADAASAAIAKRIGVIKAINGSAITLAPESGPDVAVNVAPVARILRIAPGEKDLKNAASIQLQDLKVGDTIRVRGHAAGQGIDALEVLVITSSAVDAVRTQIQQDWQKRGVWGLVDSVDVASGKVSLSVPGVMNKRSVVVRTTPGTVVRRYSPDSARPEDAKQVTLHEIQVGDQLRTLGNRSPDGSEIAAEEIFTGVFQQFDATIKSIDANAGTLSVQDLKSKKTLQLKINRDSQLHQIPMDMAQRVAAMLKMATSGTLPGAGRSDSASTQSAEQGNAGSSGRPAAGTISAPGNGGPGGARPGGGGMAGEFQRRLDQTPLVALSDLHKGEVIAVLTTEGTPSRESTVIKMFSGVEPILQAAPSASQAMMLTPWSLGGAPGGEAMQ